MLSVLRTVLWYILTFFLIDYRIHYVVLYGTGTAQHGTCTLRQNLTGTLYRSNGTVQYLLHTRKLGIHQAVSLARKLAL